MGTTDTALDADWLGLCRRAVEGLAGVLAASPTTARARSWRRAPAAAAATARS